MISYTPPQREYGFDFPVVRFSISSFSQTDVIVVDMVIGSQMLTVKTELVSYKFRVPEGVSVEPLFEIERWE